MEKPITKAKATKTFSFLPKPASFSIAHHAPPFSPGRENPAKPKALYNRAFSGPIISIIPLEARRKEKNGGGFDAQEPTSPKVSCIGRVKNKKVCRSKRYSPPRQERKPPTTRQERKPAFFVPKMFRRRVRPNRRTDAAGSSEGTPAEAPGGAPSLGQMRRFASGRGTLGSFDWKKVERKQEAAVTGDRERPYSDEDHDAIYYSAPIVMGGGGEVAAEEPGGKKEVSLWKRRTLARPAPLRLN